MQSSNPVFARSEGFNGQRVTPASGVSYPAPGAPSAPYTDPTAWQQAPQQAPGFPQVEAPMTIDSVVQKTAATLGLVFVGAFAAWFMIGDLSEENLGLAGALATGGALIGFALAMVNSFKRIVSPALVMAYALVEGVFVGAFSKFMAAYVGGDADIILQAVLGTFVAFAGTLAAYKFFNIQVTDRFRKVFTAALMGFVGLLLLNFVLSFFSADFGLRNMSGLGLLVSVVAVIFGVFALIMDFDFVERGIEARLPERESWRAAFGLTVTLVWLYLEILRILAILRGSE